MNITLAIQKWAKGEESDLTPEQRRLISLIVTGEATERECEAAGSEFTFGVKTANIPRARVIGDALIKADDERRTLTWVLSTEKTDRAGDIIRQGGWDLTNYKQNPVVLWGHAMGFDSDADEPIGRGTSLRVEKVKNTPALVGDLEFPDEATSERGARKYRLAKAGFISAGSVGFMPKTVRHVSDDKERNELGLGRFGVLFEKQELLEFSLCAIPCNPGALQLALDAGKILPDDAKDLGDPESERELEKWARKRVRSFVDMGASPNAGVDDFTASQVALGEALTRIGASLDDFGKALRELATGQKSQAQALTDLAGCLRGGSPAPVASYGQGSGAEILNAIDQRIKSARGRK